MNVVIYARYSSESQRDASIDGQLRECRAYAERMGMTIVGTYVDRACSASKKTEKRKQFLKMIDDSAKGEFDAILVWKLDRFARNRYDSALYKKILGENHVQLISITEPISNDPQGIILESLLEGMAEYYSAELSVKVRRGQKDNAIKCLYNGGLVPFGYQVSEDKHYEINEQYAPYVREMFRRYADGDSLKQICEDLNARGIKPEHGNKFNITTLGVLLHNRKYIGEYRYRDTVVPGGVPTIIDEETFNRCQARLEQNRKKPAAGKADDPYILTSKLFCGDCGEKMVGESGNGRNEKYRYYRCLNAKRKRGCHTKGINKKLIEDLVVREAFALVQNRNLMEQLADQILDIQKAENYDISCLKQQLKDVEKKIKHLMDAILQGIITETTKKCLSDLETEKETLTSKIAEETSKRQPLTYDQIMFFLHHFSELDMEDIKDRKKIVDVFVNSVYVYNKKVVLTFNYKNETKTISLSQIKISDIEKRAPPDPEHILCSGFSVL